MLAYLNGDVPPSELDADAYRAEVADEFNGIADAARQSAG